MKVNVSVGELHGPKVRGVSEKSPKQFLRSDLLKLCLNKKHNITELFPDTTVFNN